eukprot:jgi/Ulvmu1/4129/UM019_0108.1
MNDIERLQRTAELCIQRAAAARDHGRLQDEKGHLFKAAQLIIHTIPEHPNFGYCITHRQWRDEKRSYMKQTGMPRLEHLSAVLTAMPSTPTKPASRPLHPAASPSTTSCCHCVTPATSAALRASSAASPALSQFMDDLPVHLLPETQQAPAHAATEPVRLHTALHTAPRIDTQHRRGSIARAPSTDRFSESSHSERMFQPRSPDSSRRSARSHTPTSPPAGVYQPGPSWLAEVKASLPPRKDITCTSHRDIARRSQTTTSVLHSMVPAEPEVSLEEEQEAAPWHSPEAQSKDSKVKRVTKHLVHWIRKA